VNIDKFRSFVLFLAKKAQHGANPSPGELNTATERAFVDWVMSRYGNPNEYTPGSPIPRMAWQQTQKISDDLIFLLKRHEFLIVNGRLPIPDGTTTDIANDIAGKYLHVSSIRVPITKLKKGVLKSTEPTVDILRDNELGGVLSSSIVFPTETAPVCAFYSDHIQIHPKTVKRVIFTYLRTPVIPVWAFTLVNNRPVYDASNSVDIEAPDEVQNEIAYRTLSYLGISIREAQVVQWAEAKKAAGN